jgi:hypothetical protein
MKLGIGLVILALAAAPAGAEEAAPDFELVQYFSTLERLGVIERVAS